ncbi:MAG: neuraminidase-like domain-containing protein, partial [Methylotetracoccus sp.]|nr:neuraminidase-like domain-containing protein [Methylotetracoccus sp.]
MSSKIQTEIQEVIAKNRPDYASLFGSFELCDCEHCRSIYSPAAYLVDLLQFLDPKIPGVTPLDVLIGNSNKKWPDGKPIVGRRPDLAHIQLSCENTNTTLPYVDLVNEVLESYIAFEQTLPLQKTDAGGAPLSPPVPLPNESSAGVTAAELAANPENTRDQAYEVLDAAVYPFILPFNQPITALRLALEQMGTSRHEVMTVFGKKSDEAAGCARDVEALKIAEREFTVLTGEQFDGTPATQSVSDYYGFEMPMPPADTAWIAGAVPAGAQQHILNDTWVFAALNPPPDSGVLTHASMVTGGLHQHYFDKVPDAVKLTVEKEDILFSEIFLDPANLPQQIMLQWSDGTWEHRAYWGPSKTLIKLGVEGTPSCRYMGPLPEPGTWHRLEVPAFFVGLADRDLSGMAFTLFGGGATWGAAGKRSPSWVEWLTHVPTFLARAGVTYIELIELLRVRYINPARPQGEALSTFERMPISYGELSRLVGNNFADPSAQTLKALAGAGMTLNDAAAWAEEHFEPLGKLIVLDAPDSACDLALTRLQHLDGTLLEEAELHRLHRFLRLWCKIGWSMPDVERAMVALQAPDITPALLRQLGQIVQLQAILKLAPQQMLSFWGIIPVTGPDALYGKLFLNKAVRDIDPEFAPVEGEYLSAADLKINNHVPALLAGLRTRAADLVMIREHNGLAGDAAPLTLATATALYRHVTLARALKIAVKDLIALLTLSGERPFSALSDSNGGFNDIDPARTIRFVRLVDRVKRSGFAPAVLSYLFSNQEDDPSNLSPGDASIDLLVSTIRDGLVRIAAENIPVDDPIGEVTRTKLGLLFEAHIVEEITGLIAGTRIFTVPLTKLPAGVALPEGKVAYDEKDSHLLTAEGWLIDTEKAALLALSSDENYQKAINSLYNQPRELLHETLVNRLGWKTAEADLKASVLELTSFDADGNPDPKRVADKFKTFMAGALSHLRNALGRAFVKQTLADAMNLEPATAALLLEGANGVVPLGADAERSLPAIADFLTLVGDGLTAAYFGNENWNGLSEIRLDPVVDFRWDARHGFSVRWEGTLLADRTQRYLFHLRAGGSATLTLDGNLLIEQQEDSMPVEYAEAVDLEAGRHYNLKLEYANHTAQALIELRWSGPAIPAEIVPSYRLYSTARRDVVTAAKHSCIRLHKASLIVGGSILTPREIAHLSHPDRADALHLNALPVGDDSADQRILFAAWTRWSDFAALRMAASANPAALLDVFTAATVEQAHTALVRAMGWDSAVFAELAGILENLDYKDPATLFEMVEAMRLWVKLGVPAAQVFRWATHAPTMQQARDAAQEAKRALKAKYDNEAWLEIARPLADRLRESQRAALVAYLLPRLGYTDPSQLFEHFLIDVEMSPCMQTSRIKQAISSVQIFVQRCRMNLEGPQVSPKMIDGSRWQWMQNYRVWEANLKVFLYPENWIEPELRDDKSPFFRELEAELLQAEVTTESAESALGNYLEKLDTVSQLKICGLYEQTDFAADERRESVLHVFGHTFATPRSFYYRQLVTVNPNYRYWTAWEQVPLDIQADEVLPVIWNRRLYVFWKVITEKADMDTKTKYSVVRLAWSEYRQGKWTSKHMTPYKDSVAIASPAARMNVEIRGDELKIVFALMEGGAGSNPTVSTVGGAPTSKTASYIAIEKRFGSLRFLNYNGKVEPSEANTSKTYSRGFLEASSQDLQFLPVASPDQSIPVFARSANMIELYSPGSQPFTLNAYFFVQEGPRAYLVLPSSSEQSDVERLLTTKVQPFLAGAKASGPLAADKESGVALQASFAKLSAKANPWLSGRASIAATETRTVLKTDAAKPSGLSIAAEIFKHGVIHPGALYAPWSPAEFKFETFFHPYTAEFQRRLNRYGVPGLLNIESQKAASLPKVTSFKDAYDPDWMTVKTPWPAHDVDFTFTGAYSNYNWEVFFHVPLLIASRLSKNQRFEEAMRWFHYIFNPTAGTTADSVPQSYWNVLPLREAYSQRLDEMLKALNEGNVDAVAQWEDLQAHPFQPHRVARLRRIAYQKTVVMKYIDNLIAWGDQLFHQDTIETINQATQLYVLAAALLGPRVQRLPPRGRNIPRTYAQLRAGLDKFNQAMVSFENDLPFSSRATCGEVSTESTGLLGIG